jgi:hypothetical protein
MRPRVVRAVGIEAVLDPSRRALQHLAAQCPLQCLEVQGRAGARADQGVDLAGDVHLEGRREPPFWAVAGAATPGARSWASHSWALTAMNSRARRRNRRYSAICASVRATAGPAGTIVVTVFPPTAWVKDQLGPCPRAPGCAQWHPGFPHFRYRPTRDPGRRSPTLVRLSRKRARRCSNSWMVSVCGAMGPPYLTALIAVRVCATSPWIVKCVRGLTFERYTPR